ncbi:hypothetical protein PSTG_17485 [Puccinia striiformis f. sp. tritici PST-78]|uniref:Uncharacterized protein n=1 Tax=Puccinia striiformis f. sp. tritici PST-78 TaxID=1165861 RepID=A0A0L0UPR0_9BASI|nr:hypothetical protein PSTG_17485 [Puccinia striiformis f. sp. tritici PST-78]
MQPSFWQCKPESAGSVVPLITFYVTVRCANVSTLANNPPQPSATTPIPTNPSWWSYTLLSHFGSNWLGWYIPNGSTTRLLPRSSSSDQPNSWSPGGLAPPPILTSTELGHLTKDLGNLNFWQADIEMAEGAPIVDSGNLAFITCQGNLQFSGLNNQCVIILGVLYCKLARTTLISLAAFRKANTFFTYNVMQDT